MKKKQLFILNLFLLNFLCTTAQNYEKEFENFCQTKDTASLKELLEKWEAHSPNDAELYTSYFNYYYLKSGKEMVFLEGMPENEQKGDSSKAIGNMYSKIVYDEILVQKGLNKINTGIEKYPTRLDMYFGKIYVLGKMEKWSELTNEIIKTIEVSQKINNQWTWTHNEPLDDAENFFLSGLQEYFIQLFNTGEDSLAGNMRRISLKELEYYPNRIESLSNLAITWMLDNEYDKALESLLNAEKLNPEDYIVLGNIAHAYWLKEDNQNAIKYYQKVIKYGDTSSQEFAKNRIAELNKK